MGRLVLCVVLMSCGVQSDHAFVLDTPDCALVNNFTIGSAPTTWSDCRVYWSGPTTNVLVVDLTTPGTSGLFVAPDPSWLRVGMRTDGGNVTRTITSYPAPGSLPTSLATDEVALGAQLPGCEQGLSSTHSANVMAEVGEINVGFSLGLSVECGDGMPPLHAGDGFILTAAAQAGSVTDRDPGEIVGPLP